MPIRPAQSVNILKRRLAAVESGPPDAMELIGIFDELTRLERKWLEQTAQGSPRRQPDDPRKLSDWFQRLARQVERALRVTDLPPAEREWLGRIATECQQRLNR